MQNGTVMKWGTRNNAAFSMHVYLFMRLFMPQVFLGEHALLKFSLHHSITIPYIRLLLVLANDEDLDQNNYN
jgi:hypothetical protein